MTLRRPGGVLGVDLGGHAARAVWRASDGTTTVLGERSVPRDARRTQLSATLGELVRDAPSDVWVTGLAVSGALDAHGRLQRSLALPALEGRSPADEFCDQLPGRVLTCHDTRAALWAEYRHGAAQQVDDVVLVHLGRRPSFALLLDGRPHLGAHGSAGELSANELLPSQYDSASPPDGSPTRIETPDHGPASVRRAEASADLSGHSLRAALAGDDDALAAGRDFVTRIGPQVAFALGLVDPELLVAAGPLAHALASELPDVLTTVLAPRLQRVPAIAVSPLDQFATATGAADLACDALWRHLLDGPDGVLPLAAASLASLA